ncbi:MAG: 23S rRNA (guanosine(2251)-2'-O)-methyltransferase RlmB, partial [Chloroflexi bacterium]|nr:23S rRNA (guanosine(2251)-2'-O)-methyltransferase RlmB [Chloroflexota bacterium]
HRVLVARGAHGVDALLALARARHIAVEPVERHRLDQALHAAHHQGVAAEVSPFAYSPLDDLVQTEHATLLLILDSLQDPQNFGTLLRTAQACGADGVIIPEHRAVGVTPAVSNASAGAVEHLRVARVTNLTRALEDLKQRGVWTYGLVVDASQPFWSVDWTTPSALIVGSEGTGISRLVREHCDALVNIPMSDGAVQSLNAAVAGSLVLYEALRQRRQGRQPQRR